MIIMSLTSLRKEVNNGTMYGMKGDCAPGVPWDG